MISSTRSSASLKAALKVSRLSPTIDLRTTSMPSLFSSSVRKSELVSTRSGVSSSEPTAMISAFITAKTQCFSGFLKHYAEVDRSKVWNIEEVKMCHSVPVGTLHIRRLLRLRLLCLCHLPPLLSLITHTAFSCAFSFHLSSQRN